MGNGISIIIFAGILSTLPSSIIQFAQQAFVGNDDTTLAWLKVIGLVVGLILLTIGAIYVLEAKRKIPIQYAKTISSTIRFTSNLSTFGKLTQQGLYQ